MKWSLELTELLRAPKISVTPLGFAPRLHGIVWSSVPNEFRRFRIRFCVIRPLTVLVIGNQKDSTFCKRLRESWATKPMSNIEK